MWGRVSHIFGSQSFSISLLTIVSEWWGQPEEDEEGNPLPREPYGQEEDEDEDEADDVEQALRDAEAF